MKKDFSSTSRRSFLRNAALASGAIASSQAPPSAAASPAPGSNAVASLAGKPNILMFCTDQFRADFVGASGQNPSVKTPNIDALAKRGTYFRTAICNQPLCSPSRASFVTRHA